MSHADVCMLLEGTYPYVAGGVSGWVHDLLCGHPELRFALVHIGVQPETALTPRYPVPGNVVELCHLYCQDAPLRLPYGAARAALDRRIAQRRRRGSQDARPDMVQALARLHLEGQVDDTLVMQLAAGDVSVDDLLHGAATFALIDELAERLAPDSSFLDFFWHFRAMHVPLVRLLSAELPAAAVYHTVTTGYAGVLGAIASARRGRPLLITEHGLYAREREIELARAEWIEDSVGVELRLVAAARSPLRSCWSRFFRRLAEVAYCQASQIVTLSEVNRRKQIADGAPPERTRVVPNGVDVERLGRIGSVPSSSAGWLRVGFVGRVVPIKDVVNFIRACDLALASVPLEVKIIGPTEEEPAYAERCRALCAELGRQAQIHFVGSQPLEHIYGQLDVVVLTSLSEGQPLAILEAFGAGLPVVATDVGGCRELIEGRPGPDQRLGSAGLVTRIACPDETAAALVRLARDPSLRVRMGRVGQRRVALFYQQRDMLESYRALYRSLVMS